MTKLFLPQFILFFLILSVTNFPKALSQTAVEAISDESALQNSEIINEKILKVSGTKKNFLITNSSNNLNAGDFISLLNHDHLLARAMVVKIKNELVGIKIVKIYSLREWNAIKAPQDIQILKGDDSYYLNSKSKISEDKVKEIDDSKNDSATTTEDLFSKTKIDEDDTTLNEKPDRILKTDNIIGVYYGSLSKLNTQEPSTSYSQYGFSWNYQFADNIWGELLYGRSTMDQFPSTDISTSVTNITIRGKYSFSAPLYSYFLPYVGMQFLSASSQDAGKSNSDDLTEEEQDQLDQEVMLVEDINNKKTVIFGLTILKRLVPGWFLRADLGTDILNAGVSIEF